VTRARASSCRFTRDALTTLSRRRSR
jgi:hypothetical protein